MGFLVANHGLIILAIQVSGLRPTPGGLRGLATGGPNMIRQVTRRLVVLACDTLIELFSCSLLSILFS
jgi:hypothetical protein